MTPEHGTKLVGKPVGSRVRPPGYRAANTRALSQMWATIRRALGQPNACQCCGKEGSTVLDHCHRTDRLRGWVCRSCNGLLASIDRGRRVPTTSQQAYLARAGMTVEVPELPDIDGGYTDRWMQPQEAAALLGVGAETLVAWNVPFARLYSERALYEWCDQRNEEYRAQGKSERVIRP